MKENNEHKLRDRFGRSIDYIRVSVTDRCDLRCFYCLPESYKNFQEPEEWLSFDEVHRVVRLFTELGTRRVRLTGGEPLVRKNIPDLASQLSSIPGLEDLSLSTNATRLGKYAYELKKAGVTRLNVSLDSLQAERYKKITKGNLDKVINGLMAAKDAGFKPIKINTVLMNDVNLDEVDAMVQFCIEHDFTLRFIETMPIGAPGVDASQFYVNLQEVKRHLMNRYDAYSDVMPGGGPARYIRIANTDLRIGFITPMSQHFCDTCNRVRLSVDGTLYMCLGQNHSFALRPLLRDGASDDEIKQAIRHAIELKPEKHEFNEKPSQVVRFMSMTGG